MTSVKKILIACDGSPAADAALDELTRAGLPVAAEAVVLCVADVWLPAGLPHFPENLAFATARSYEQALQAVEKCRGVAARGAGRLRALFPKWDVRAESCADSPPWAVVRHANDWGADLVVVGAHSHSALQRFFLGSVASRVAAEARCSVRIARPRPHARHSGLRVMIALDGSQDSVTAVEAVGARLWPSGAEFQIVTVIDPKLRTAAAWQQAVAATWANEHSKGAEECIGRMVQHFGDTLRSAGHPVETHVFEGDPKAILIRQAENWDADCIFLGARGLHHGERTYFGSLVSAVAARAHCSVEIVRHAGAIAPPDKP